MSNPSGKIKTLLNIPCFSFLEEEIGELMVFGFKRENENSLIYENQRIRKVISVQAKLSLSVYDRQPSPSDIQFELITSYMDIHMMGASSEKFPCLEDLKRHLMNPKSES